MMTESEKETLNFAAEAAGITIKWDGSADDKWPLKYENGSCRVWNPLHDDGDALRLACKLALVVYCDEFEAWCEWGELNENAEYEHHVSAEPEYQGAQSVRRAIVLAAAEIGRAM